MDVCVVRACVYGSVIAPLILYGTCLYLLPVPGKNTAAINTLSVTFANRGQTSFSRAGEDKVYLGDTPNDSCVICVATEQKQTS